MTARAWYWKEALRLGKDNRAPSDEVLALLVRISLSRN